MKRLLVCLLVLVLALGIVGCDSGGDSSSSDGGGSSSSSGSGSSSSNADEITTIEGLEAALADGYADAAWYPDITDITMETYLGAEVLVLHTTWYAEGGDWMVDNDKKTALQDALYALDTQVAANIAMIDSQGTVYSLSGSSINGTVPMNDAFALPAAPTTAEEFKAWLDAVYGPGGLIALGANETWHADITSVTYEDLGWGSGPQLVIRTNIAAADKTQQSLLSMAITNTGSPLLSSVALYYAGDSSSAYGGGAGTPGQSGFFYPAE